MNFRTRLSRAIAVATALALSVLLLGGCNRKKDTSEAPAVQEWEEMTSFELLDKITVGWSLGNTLDAYTEGKTSENPDDYETSWGNPKTTEEMILKVKEKGFNTIRLPITWSGHIGDAPAYTINAAWMNRVQEVVDYVVKNDLYCIINLHHETWHFPSYANLETAKAELTAVWTQIADRFSGYDEHLIFEGLNEPRKKDTPQEWTGGDTESRDVINQLNAVFVETIRASKDNNPKRHLMIPTYAASASSSTIGDFVVPKDDHIIVSIHAYTPYNFALNKKGTFEFDPTKDGGEIDNLMQLLKASFLEKGYPVLIGEFGAMNKYNTDARCAWATYYVQQATAANIRCVWWDNGAFTSGEAFGLLNRNTLTWEYPEVVDALMAARGK